ncbi:MAG TPA: T9SS type A sorting domain-containing protein, partial [bacterium]
WYDDFSIEPIDAVPTSVSDPGNYIRAEIPNEFELGQNYPNPFNPETSIKYSAPKDGSIQIEVYNILGKKVRTLFDGQQAAGTYEVRWNARDDYGSTLSSGVYLITLRSGNFVTAKRITLLK